MNDLELRPFQKADYTIKYKEHSRIIKNEIDLSIIKAKLNGNKYSSPFDLEQDFKLIYENPKLYEDKNITLYTKTLKFKSLVIEKMEKIKQIF